MNKIEKGWSDQIYFPTIACGVFSLMLGIMVLVGWYTHNPGLVQVLPNLVPMQYNTALGFMLCGLGLVAARFGLLVLSRICGLTVGLLGVLTLIEYLTGINLHFDELFMNHSVTIESAFPGRMASTTAFGFCLMSAVLLMARQGDQAETRPTRRFLIQGIFGMLVVSLGSIGAFNALFNVQVFFGFWKWPYMAILTAIGFLVLGIGVVTFSWRKGNAQLPILFVLVFGTAVSFMSYFSLTNIEEQSATANFRYESQDRFALFKEEMENNLSLVKSLWAFYDSSELVAQDEFYRFTKSSIGDNVARRSLAWIPYLQDVKRAKFEEQAKKEGNPDFKILEMDGHGNQKVSPVRSEYFPICYIEPGEGQMLPVGFNLGSLPPLMKALRESRDSGRSVATGKIGLNYRKVQQDFFIFIFRPIYQKGVIEDSIVWRRNHLLGFATGVFRINDLMENILTKLRMAQMDIYLYDKSASVGERFLYQHRTQEGQENAVPIAEDQLTRLSGLYYVNTVDVVGRKWLFLSIPSVGHWASQRTWLPWAAFFAVLYISLLLAYYLWGTRQHTTLIENAVTVRTAELQQANEALRHQIEERRRTEDKLREMTAAMENAVEGISQLNETGKYVYVNKAYAEMMGYQVQELTGQSWEHYIEPADLQKVRKAYEDMLTKGKAEVETRSLHKDGTVSYKQLTMVKTFSPESRYKGFYCFVKDISESKYKQMIDVKTELITMVSHELRSPLHSVREGICIVLEGLLGEVNADQRDALMTSRKSIDRLVRLVNNVLDFRRLEDGVVTFLQKKTDVNTLVKESRDTFEAIVQSKGLAFQLELEPHLPEVELDSDRITQVLSNFIDNAIKFTEKGTITIATAANKREIIISVQDTGVGIKADNVSKLFKKFGQLDGHEGKQFGGSGLGLAISKRIVEQHGGRVWVESEYQRGSKFCFSLPLKSPAILRGG